MNRIFTKLRCSMGPERLSDLALCAYYKQECGKLETKEIIEIFDKISNRRYNLY